MPAHRTLLPLLLLSTLAQAQQRTIAITFDDLPMTVVGNDHIAGPLDETRFISASILHTLAAHHATALGLVNEAKLNVQGERDARAQLLEDWLNAGMILGNHGYSHREFKDLSLAEYQAEFLRGDVITVPLLQAHHIADRFWRPPYLDTGDTPAKKQAFDQFLTAHGYRVAPYTIQDDDWMFNATWDEARRAHNTATLDRTRAAYLAHITDIFNHAEAQTRGSFGRDIPQILFIHTDVLNADTLDQVLTLVEQRGYHFVSLDQVLADPAYKTPDAFVGPDGLSWLDRWQPALGHPVHPTVPEPPTWIRDNYARITAPIPSK